MVLVTKAFNKDFGRTFNISMPYAKRASLSQAKAAENYDRSLLCEATSNLIQTFLFSSRSARVSRRCLFRGTGILVQGTASGMREADLHTRTTEHWHVV